MTPYLKKQYILGLDWKMFSTIIPLRKTGRGTTNNAIYVCLCEERLLKNITFKKHNQKRCDVFFGK